MEGRALMLLFATIVIIAKEVRATNGRCPTSSSHCLPDAVRCNDDLECPDEQRCCEQNCGKVCVDSLFTGCENVRISLNRVMRALTLDESKYARDSKALQKRLRTPRCRDIDGEFEQIQCDDGTCWCVDKKGFEIAGTRSHADSLKSCNETAPCAAYTCRMLCPLGFELDGRGCPLCKCRDPCAQIPCPTPLSCQLEEKPCRTPPCPPLPTCKRARSLENICPVGDPLMISETRRPFLCGNDEGKPNCPPLYRCFVDSGNDYGVCCPASLELKKAGICPVEPVENYDCGLPCTHDLECPSVQKCCDDLTCGKHCAMPNNVTECLQQKMLAELLIVNEREGKGYIPQCSPADGSFETRQCSRNGLVCWCVDKKGHKIRGSMGPSNVINCTAMMSSMNRGSGRSMGPSDGCDRQLCASVCEYGYKVGLDGCPTCECDDPCVGFPCKQNEECVRMKDAACTGSLCSSYPVCRPHVTFENPCVIGVPFVNSTIGQVVSCSSTLECPAYHTCTKLGKINKSFCCPNAIDEIPQCPTNLDVMCGLNNSIACRSDNDCEASYKCCPTSDCGSLCVNNLKWSLQENDFDDTQSVCEYLRDFDANMEGTQDGMKLALPVPRCHSNGSFVETQCAPVKNNLECWCVDSFGTEIPRTRGKKSPLTDCVKLRYEIDCLDMTCRMGCDYGFELDPDSRCPTCRCRDPCNDVKCPRGNDCKMIDVACDGEYCPPVPACLPRKTGQCPYLVPSVSPTCEFVCKSDEECGPDSRCCPNGCGTTCSKVLSLTACEHRKAIALHDASESGRPGALLWIPSCNKENGRFEKIQCKPVDRTCWCVDESGIEIPKTRTFNDSVPNCDDLSSSACPELDCDIECEHGNSLDEKGCPLCSCHDPCTEMHCSDEEECKLMDVECSSGPCPRVPRCLSIASCPGGATPLSNSEGPTTCGPGSVSCPSTHSCQLQPHKHQPSVCCPKPRSVCFETLDEGSCDSGDVNLTRWYFNPSKNRCFKFVFHGCTGNHNNFHTEEMCNAVCPVLSPCERLRERNALIAVRFNRPTFHPACDPESGAWLHIQCMNHIDVCWCVNSKGEPQKGTLVRGGKPDCNFRKGRMHASPTATTDGVLEELIRQMTTLRIDFDENDITTDDGEPTEGASVQYIALESKCNALRNADISQLAELKKKEEELKNTTIKINKLSKENKDLSAAVRMLKNLKNQKQTLKIKEIINENINLKNTLNELRNKEFNPVPLKLNANELNIINGTQLLYKMTRGSINNLDTFNTTPQTIVALSIKPTPMKTNSKKCNRNELNKSEQNKSVIYEINKFDEIFRKMPIDKNNFLIADLFDFEINEVNETNLKNNLRNNFIVKTKNGKPYRRNLDANKVNVGNMLEYLSFSTKKWSFATNVHNINEKNNSHMQKTKKFDEIFFEAFHKNFQSNHKKNKNSHELFLDRFKHNNISYVMKKLLPWVDILDRRNEMVKNRPNLFLKNKNLTYPQIKTIEKIYNDIREQRLNKAKKNTHDRLKSKLKVQTGKVYQTLRNVDLLNGKISQSGNFLSKGKESVLYKDLSKWYSVPPDLKESYAFDKNIDIPLIKNNNSFDNININYNNSTMGSNGILSNKYERIINKRFNFEDNKHVYKENFNISGVIFDYHNYSKLANKKNNSFILKQNLNLPNKTKSIDDMYLNFSDKENAKFLFHNVIIDLQRKISQLKKQYSHNKLNHSFDSLLGKYAFSRRCMSSKTVTLNKPRQLASLNQNTSLISKIKKVFGKYTFSKQNLSDINKLKSSYVINANRKPKILNRIMAHYNPNKKTNTSAQSSNKYEHFIKINPVVDSKLVHNSRNHKFGNYTSIILENSSSENNFDSAVRKSNSDFKQNRKLVIDSTDYIDKKRVRSILDELKASTESSNIHTYEKLKQDLMAIFLQNHFKKKNVSNNTEWNISPDALKEQRVNACIHSTFHQNKSKENSVSYVKSPIPKIPLKIKQNITRNGHKSANDTFIESINKSRKTKSKSDLNRALFDEMANSKNNLERELNFKIKIMNQTDGILLRNILQLLKNNTMNMLTNFDLVQRLIKQIDQFRKELKILDENKVNNPIYKFEKYLFNFFSDAISKKERNGNAQRFLQVSSKIIDDTSTLKADMNNYKIEKHTINKEQLKNKPLYNQDKILIENIIEIKRYDDEFSKNITEMDFTTPKVIDSTALPRIPTIKHNETSSQRNIENNLQINQIESRDILSNVLNKILPFPEESKDNNNKPFDSIKHLPKTFQISSLKNISNKKTYSNLNEVNNRSKKHSDFIYKNKNVLPGNKSRNQIKIDPILKRITENSTKLYPNLFDQKISCKPLINLKIITQNHNCSYVHPHGKRSHTKDLVNNSTNFPLNSSKLYLNAQKQVKIENVTMAYIKQTNDSRMEDWSDLKNYIDLTNNNSLFRIQSKIGLFESRTEPPLNDDDIIQRKKPVLSVDHHIDDIGDLFPSSNNDTIEMDIENLYSNITIQKNASTFSHKNPIINGLQNNFGSKWYSLLIKNFKNVQNSLKNKSLGNGQDLKDKNKLIVENHETIENKIDIPPKIILDLLNENLPLHELFFNNHDTKRLLSLKNEMRYDVSRQNTSKKLHPDFSRNSTEITGKILNPKIPISSLDDLLSEVTFTDKGLDFIASKKRDAEKIRTKSIVYKVIDKTELPFKMKIKRKTITELDDSPLLQKSPRIEVMTISPISDSLSNIRNPALSLKKKLKMEPSVRSKVHRDVLNFNSPKSQDNIIAEHFAKQVYQDLSVFSNVGNYYMPTLSQPNVRLTENEIIREYAYAKPIKNLVYLGNKRKETTNDFKMCKPEHSHLSSKGHSDVMCEPDGAFKPTQCANGTCWCVDEVGNVVPDSETFPATAQNNRLCYHVPIESVQMELTYETSTAAETARDALEAKLQELFSQSTITTRNDGVNSVLMVTLRGKNCAKKAYHIERILRESKDSPIAAADVIRVEYRISNIASSAMRQREIITESTLHATNYHTAIIVLAATSAFIISVLSVLLMLYRKQVSKLVSSEKNKPREERFLPISAPVYVLSTDEKRDLAQVININESHNERL